MRFNLYTAILLLLMTASGWAMGQAPRRVCGSDELFEQSLQTIPGARQNLEEAEARYQAALANGEKRMGGVRTIPCVVHIIQSSGVELVSDADVQSQIDVLNEDFRKIAGSPGDGAGVDMLYEFCLATIDPSGCATTGINRVVSPANAYHDQADAAQLKGLIQWDPHMYFNIWVPRTIETQSSSGQVIGYATFPNFLPFQPNLDGVVVHSGYFGRDADPTTIGRTATHEVGHWIGLYHTFQNGCSGSSAGTCATNGDRVCDTPQAFEANFQCPNINSCTDTPTDFPDQIENYMDYSNGTCQNMYTAGQRDRADVMMQNYRSQIYSPANLTATGCDGTAAPGCAPTAEFKSNVQSVCVGIPVNFTDLSNGVPTGWTWSFQGGTPSTSSIQNPTVTYSTAGVYNVSLTATNGLGQTTEAKAGYIVVTDPSQPPLMESFESILSLPQGWSTEDEDQVPLWTLVTNAGSQGTKSMKAKNWQSHSSGTFDNLNTHPLDLTNALEASLTYDWSYKKKDAFALDCLWVNISIDCGATWTNLKKRVGPTLITVAGLSTSVEFVPSQAAHWKSDTIDLTPYVGQSQVKIQFRNVGADGQSLYLDNINLNTIMVGTPEAEALAWSMDISPNPFHDALTVHYSVAKPGSTRFSLIDATGKLLYQFETGKQAPGQYTLPVATETLRDLPAGMYFLKGEGTTGSITRKLVKVE